MFLDFVQLDKHEAALLSLAFIETCVGKMALAPHEADCRKPQRPPRVPSRITSVEQKTDNTRHGESWVVEMQE